MKFERENGWIKITDAGDFDLEKIFECGQCFRWYADADGVYTGVAKGHVAQIYKDESGIYISGTEAEFEAVWRDYFDLGRDYGEIRRLLCIDDYMRAASEFGAGIRILRQDRWEALCSFIISQCNNIPRIKKIIETFCACFGDAVEYRGETYYAFPPAEKVAKLAECDLAPLRCGYRAAYIIDAARAVAYGDVDLDALAEGTYLDALSALKTINGVGDKVANCVILFGLQMLSAFPVDVWMKKAIAKHYRTGFDSKIFGKYAGIAQQYMFFYSRSGEDCAV